MTAPITTRPVTVKARSSSSSSRKLLILLPGVALLLAGFVYPLANIIWLSFTSPEPGLGNYVRLFTDNVSGTILIRTLQTSAIVACFTLILAYPYAYAMTKVSAKTRGILTILVLLPFWTSMMARNFAWYLLEQRGGPIHRFFEMIGIPDVVLLGSVLGVTVAMVQVMLPFAVLPLYASLSGIDSRLMNAASSCGASWLKAFRTIYLPLSVPGMVSAFSLVLILSLGFYVTPAILGSPQQALVSQLIQTRVTELLDFGGGGALGMVLLFLTLIVLAIVAYVGRLIGGGKRG